MTKGGHVGLYVEPQPPHDYIQLGNSQWYRKSEAHEVGLELAAEAMRDDLTRQEHYEAMAEVPDGVGDVNSTEKGSGARYNAGKPPMAYIPLRQQLIVMKGYKRFDERIKLILQELIRFEQREVPMWNVISLLRTDDLIDASYVWAYGAQKYAPFNWAKGMKWSIPLSCISRHLQAILKGEELDDESGCKHWGHVVCNLLMLEHYEQYYDQGDDRPPAEAFK